MSRRPLLLTATSLLLAAAACGSNGPAAQGPLPGGGFPDAGGGSGGSCDVDGDGVDGPACNGQDCADTDAAVRPGAAETCNGKDDDCDGHVDEGCGCTPGDMERCFDGDPLVRGVGHCADGQRTCSADGVWGPCTGSVGPENEQTGCDGIDSDCDGKADSDPTCGNCPPDAQEVCGNGLDDDCDGVDAGGTVADGIDPASLCTETCRDVNTRDADPGALACCVRSPPATKEFECHEGSGLDACVDRPCLDLDGSLDTRCTKFCDRTGCRCGRRLGSGELIEVADCGFLSPCARLDCDEQAGKPCYGGPPKTLGVGICHAGVHSCMQDGGGQLAWNECQGQQLPVPEICGNGIDDDCDGFIDDAVGSAARCEIRPACAPDARELCGNGLDDDCDGFADEACPALVGTRQTCWTGSLETRKVGACKDGFQIESGGFWGVCGAQVLPGREACGDNIDSDCNGLGGPGQPDEPSCCKAEGETCNGKDDDCDGIVDEGLLNRCGQCEGTGSCFGTVFSDVGDCSVPGRICESVEASRFDPTLITLIGGSTGGGGGQHLYAIQTVSGVMSLIQVDLGSGEIVWQRDYPEGGVGVPVAAGGDGSAWVPLTGYMQHVSADGEVLCRTDATSSETCPDPEGDLWVNIGFIIRRYSATELVLEQSPGVPWPDGVPRCAIVDLTPDDPNTTDISIAIANVMVHDGKREWNFGSGNGVQYIQAEDYSLHTVEPATSVWFAYPVLGPDGRLWGGGPVRWLDPEEAKDANPVAPYHDVPCNGASACTGGKWSPSLVGVLSDGSVVGVVTSPSGIVHIDGETGDEIDRFDAPADLLNEIAVDGSDHVWATAAGKLLSLDVASGTWNETPIEGVTIGRFGVSSGGGGGKSSKGRWAQLFDPGAFDVKWGELTWDSHAASGSRVSVQVRFADAPDVLEASQIVCGPFTSSPADLSACSRGRRYAMIELLLAGTGKPVAGNVGLTWDRP